MIYAALVILMAMMVYASASVEHSPYLKSLCRKKGAAGRIALTFDDGPHPVRTREVLDVLSEHGVEAAFFLIGEKAVENEDTVREIVSRGHIVGNHTAVHSVGFTFSGRKSVVKEIERCSDMLEYITGRRPRFFRPPFGVTNPAVGYAVRSLDMESAGWSVRSFDTRGESRDRVFARVVSGCRGKCGEVILLHDRCEGSAELVRRIIRHFRAEGYEFVRLDKMFGVEPYFPEGGIRFKRGRR